MDTTLDATGGCGTLRHKEGLTHEIQAHHSGVYCNC